MEQVDSKIALAIVMGIIAIIVGWRVLRDARKQRNTLLGFTALLTMGLGVGVLGFIAHHLNATAPPF